MKLILAEVNVVTNFSFAMFTIESIIPLFLMKIVFNIVNALVVGISQ